MSTQENKTNFNWVYYVLGMVFGIATGFVVTGDYIFALLGAVLGLLTAGLFLNALVKGRSY